jgi:uroporphyrinogen-III decarboxylase
MYVKKCNDRTAFESFQVSVLKTVIHFNQKQSIRLKTYCSYGANVLGVDWENAAHDRLKIMNM